MLCLAKNRLDTKLLRIHLFSVFTIKRPRAPVLWSLNRVYTPTITHCTHCGDVFFFIIQVIGDVYKHTLTPSAPNGCVKSMLSLPFNTTSQLHMYYVLKMVSYYFFKHLHV